MNSPNLIEKCETLDLSDCLFNSTETMEMFGKLIETATYTKVFRVSLQFPDRRVHWRTEPVEGNRSMIIGKEPEGSLREVHRQVIDRPLNYQVLTDHKIAIYKNGHELL